MKNIFLVKISQDQDYLKSIIKTMPKISAKSGPAQLRKLQIWFYENFEDAEACLYSIKQNLEDGFGLSESKRKSKTTLSARGWHKDHYNYNKAEKYELPPSLRRTPARNVTKAGTKRKRKTNIKRYK